MQAKPSVSEWRQHSRVLFVYIGYFLASFVVPRQERKQDIYFEFRQSFKLWFLVPLFGDCLNAYLYFSKTFFWQYHLFASSAQRVNKTQSYNSKVGWDRQYSAAVWSEADGLPTAAEESRSNPINWLIRSHGEVNGRGLDLCTWRAAQQSLFP